MLGDGVNDVPALKAPAWRSRRAAAPRWPSVADLVLVDGDFDAIPQLVHEGRQALRNLQRVTKLYVTKSAFAAFLILTIGTTSDAYPLLPRHLSLAAAVTIGIPTFFLALAPPRPLAAGGICPRVARFAVPAGTIAGVGIVTGYLFALHDLDYSVAQARVIASTVLVIAGLYLVYAIEGGSLKRRTAVGSMCFALLGLYVAAILLPPARHFFMLEIPGPGMIVTSLFGAALAILALFLAGFPANSARGSHDGSLGEFNDVGAGAAPVPADSGAPR